MTSQSLSAKICKRNFKNKSLEFAFYCSKRFTQANLAKPRKKISLFFDLPASTEFLSFTGILISRFKCALPYSCYLSNLIYEGACKLLGVETHMHNGNLSVSQSIQESYVLQALAYVRKLVFYKLSSAHRDSAEDLMQRVFCKI